MPRNRPRNCRIGAALLAFISATALLASAQTAVTTYHNDNYRTGWNQHESVLTPANVTNKTFGRLQTVKLDDQVDAQPLVVPGRADHRRSVSGHPRCGLWPVSHVGYV